MPTQTMTKSHRKPLDYNYQSQYNKIMDIKNINMLLEDTKSHVEILKNIFAENNINCEEKFNSLLLTLSYITGFFDNHHSGLSQAMIESI